LNQDETPPFEAVSQRHQQQKTSSETELCSRWREPDHGDLAREGGFHDAEHGLVEVVVGNRHAARDRHRQRHAKVDRRAP
jgi:hypothetical protein